MYRFRLLLCLLLLPLRSLAADAPPVFRRVIVASTDARALAVQPGAEIVQFDQLPALNAAELTTAVRPLVGQPITTQLINDLIALVTMHARNKGGVLDYVTVPTPQDIGSGAIRLVLSPAQFNQVNVQGNRWFSRQLLEQRLGIKPGDQIRVANIEEAVNWANTNPFRHVQVLIQPLPGDPNKADLVVAVQERPPYRVSAMYANGGVKALGRSQYVGSLQFGNLWGHDHQATYQYITTDRSNEYSAHTLDYRVPLRWRHMLQFNSAFGQVHPRSPDIAFNQKGQSLTSTLRYTAPFRWRGHTAEVFAGVDFKQSNNNLEYGGRQAYASKAEVFQGSLGFNLVRRDQRGAWGLSGTIFASPGNITPHNDDTTFTTTRFGSKPRYVYGNISIQRVQNFEKGWELLSRATLQHTSTNLLGSEQLSIGGVGTVRGYETSRSSGDKGLVFNNDLQTPIHRRTLEKLSKRFPPLEARGVFFFDVGSVSYRFPLAKGLEPALAPLASVGVGTRLNVGNNFSMSIDYGWQLTHGPALVLRGPREELNSRGHVKVLLAF